MTVVPATTHAMVFSARPYQLEVFAGFKSSGQGRKKAWPAGATVKLHVRCKQGQVAASADIRTFAFFIVQRAGTGALGTFMSQHAVGVGAEKLLPFFVTANDFVGHLFLLRMRVVGAAEHTSEQNCVAGGDAAQRRLLQERTAIHNGFPGLSDGPIGAAFERMCPLSQPYGSALTYQFGLAVNTFQRLPFKTQRLRLALAKRTGSTKFGDVIARQAQFLSEDFVVVFADRR